MGLNARKQLFLSYLKICLVVCDHASTNVLNVAKRIFPICLNAHLALIAHNFDALFIFSYKKKTIYEEESKSSIDVSGKLIEPMLS